ncbi:hypothetical protein BJX68DRAFT_270652 [Aspergillus pseudodeflectus]|uniref:Uncharacterized protein n=1 Tax=Aspergillus pseudodeflectus TaxID=176178 RepID=A0ABR4JS85_9EURO
MCIFDAEEMLIRCDDVPVPLSALPPTALGVKEDCSADGGTGISMRHQNVADALLPRFPSTSPLRKYRAPIWSDSTRLVGNGDPHQNYRYAQISQNIACGTAPSFSVGYQKTKSFTTGWPASSANVSWISGGLAVTKTWSSGNSYPCTPGRHETVCIW